MPAVSIANIIYENIIDQTNSPTCVYPVNHIGFM